MAENKGMAGIIDEQAVQIIATEDKDRPLVKSTDGMVAPPTTTTEQDLHSASQRRVNLIWEQTQKWIALTVVIATMGTAIYVAVSGKGEGRIPTVLSVAFGTVVGFYFGRTNHQSIGGIQLGR